MSNSLQLMLTKKGMLENKICQDWVSELSQLETKAIGTQK